MAEYINKLGVINKSILGRENFIHNRLKINSYKRWLEINIYKKRPKTGKKTKAEQKEEQA